MKVGEKYYQTIWCEDGKIKIIDQRWLPHRFVIEEIACVEQMVLAIKDMHLRGAIVIGVAGAYGVYLAAKKAGQCGSISEFYEWVDRLKSARPTAVNLSWAVDRQLREIGDISDIDRIIKVTLDVARYIEKEELHRCRMIGEIGVQVIEGIYKRKQDTVNILTHCNAGWLACVDYGTATAPIYEAHRRGIPVHVWVDETRPRNQGARLTAWEMANQNVPHTVIADNTGGHLMQHGMVDMVIVGADRVSRRGDVANKIGTYLKALAAKDNGIPFYVALPTSSFDLKIYDGLVEIPIEVRSEEEVKFIQGKLGDDIVKVLVSPRESPACNYAFDVTPFNLITALITEKAIIPAQEDAIVQLLGEHHG